MGAFLERLNDKQREAFFEERAFLLRYEKAHKKVVKDVVDTRKTAAGFVSLTETGKEVLGSLAVMAPAFYGQTSVPPWGYAVAGSLPMLLCCLLWHRRQKAAQKDLAQDDSYFLLSKVGRAHTHALHRDFLRALKQTALKQG